MRNKEFAYLLNYLKTFKAVHKNNKRTQQLPVPKSLVRAVAETVTAFHLPKMVFSV